MPSLGEFLGALLSDAAQARVSADLEAVNIAARYAQDPLLRNLPVPRFRLPDINVDVPVLILSVSGSTDSKGGLPFTEPTSTELRQVQRAAFRSAGVRIPRAASSAIPSDFVERVKKLFASGSPRLLNPSSVSEDVASSLDDVVSKAFGDQLLDGQRSQLRDATARAMSELLISKQRLSLGWEVAVTASEISAQGDRGGIVHLRLTLSEDGYEIIARDDGPGFLLSPE